MDEILKNKRVLESGSVILLTNEDIAYLQEFRAAAERHTARVCATRESAMQELIDAGIYGTDGQLAEHYR